MFSALRKLRHHVARQRFAKLVKPYDDAIEAARKAHQPTKHLIAAKKAAVHATRAGAR